jgi:hypothetical protein
MVVDEANQLIRPGAACSRWLRTSGVDESTVPSAIRSRYDTQSEQGRLDAEEALFANDLAAGGKHLYVHLPLTGGTVVGNVCAQVFRRRGDRCSLVLFEQFP